MSRSTASRRSRALFLALALFATSMLAGCAVVTVAGAVVGVAATGAGLAVNAAVGAVKLTGKAVGAAADAVTPSYFPAQKSKGQAQAAARHAEPGA